MTVALFRFDQPDAAAGWAAIDDRVMGGMSRSRLRHDPAGHAVFEGQLSLARGGGFASVRARTALAGGAGAMACVVEVRGPGQPFKLGLFMADGTDALSYQQAFVPTADRWITIHLPLDGFVARFRGREVPGAPALDAARIRQVGLTIAGGPAGPFALDIRSIALA